MSESGDTEAMVPACPYDPSSLYPCEPLDKLISQGDNRYISCEQQQHQDVREEGKQRDSSIDGSGDHDDDDENNDQDNDDNVGP
jgi:hypothetical protein